MSRTLRQVVRRVRRILDPLVGSRGARKRHKRFLAEAGDIRASLDALSDKANGIDSDGRPIFVLAGGWRSGSTLVQRLLMSGESTLIWGEPFDRSCLVQRLTETVQAFGPSYPPTERFLASRGLGDLSNTWVANLYPPLDALRSSYRGLFDRLYGEPAATAGATRWGIKEVRYGENEARFLHWLYPEAVFVFLVRRPLDAYRSYVRFSQNRNWYARWPTQPVFTAGSFGRHWSETVEGLSRCADDLGALLLRYEELIEGGSVLRRLERHVGVQVHDDVLEVRIGEGTMNREIGLIDRLRIRRSTGPVARRLGY